MKKNNVKNITIGLFTIGLIAGATGVVISRFKRLKRELEYEEYEDDFKDNDKYMTVDEMNELPYISIPSKVKKVEK